MRQSGVILLSHIQAKPWLEARAKGALTISATWDLGISCSEVALRDRGVDCDGGFLPWEMVETVAAEDNKVFRWNDAELIPVRVFSETTGWVRSLYPTTSAPTVLVSGIPMHRIKDTDPVRDTKSKIKALGAPRGRVLDTATGLGYTAIEAAKTAIDVVTIELDPSALEIARMNPWSAGLFDTAKIQGILGDAFDAVGAMENSAFSAVIHDPPTTALGGDLYSLEFYEQLYRVLSRRGRLYHYVGDPDSAHGKRVYQGIMRRLTEAGFADVRREPLAYGITANKRG